MVYAFELYSNKVPTIKLNKDNKYKQATIINILNTLFQISKLRNTISLTPNIYSKLPNILISKLNILIANKYSPFFKSWDFWFHNNKLLNLFTNLI